MNLTELKSLRNQLADERLCHAETREQLAELLHLRDDAPTTIRRVAGKLAAVEKERDEEQAAYWKMTAELEDKLAAEQAECLEQAQLNGMGSEREAALMGKLVECKKERDDWKDQCRAVTEEFAEHQIADAVRLAAMTKERDEYACMSFASPLIDCMKQLSACEKERDELRAFAQAVMECWPMGDLDGGTLQDAAVAHGLLVPETRHEPCGESCSCAENADAQEWGFGVVCYRTTPLLKTP
jgi:hypothetical protein